MDAALQSYLDGDTLNLVPLVHLDFAGEPLFVWGGTSDLSWDGNTFDGVGSLGKIDGVETGSNGKVTSLKLTLGSLKPDEYDVSDSLSEVFQIDYLNRQGRLWLAGLNENNNLVGEPELMFAGPIRSLQVMDGQGTSIQLEIESREAALRRSFTKYRTDQAHREKYPDDGFFSFVTNVANKTVYWGLQADTGHVIGSAMGGNNRAHPNAVFSESPNMKI